MRETGLFVFQSPGPSFKSADDIKLILKFWDNKIWYQINKCRYNRKCHLGQVLSSHPKIYSQKY